MCVGGGQTSLYIWNIIKATPWQYEFLSWSKGLEKKSEMMLETWRRCVLFKNVYCISLLKYCLECMNGETAAGFKPRSPWNTSQHWHVFLKARCFFFFKKKKGGGHDTRSPSAARENRDQLKPGVRIQTTIIYQVDTCALWPNNTQTTASFTSLNKWVYKSTGCNSKEA